MRFILRGSGVLGEFEGDSCSSRLVNDVSYVTRINHEIHFARQAQHVVTFWEIAGARYVVMLDLD